MKLNLFILVAFIAVALALIVWAFAKSQNTNPHRRQKIGNINRAFFRRHMRKVYLAPLFVEKFAAWLGLVREPVGSVQFANVGEGVHEHGIKSYIPDAATASRYYLYQVGSTADNVAVAAGTNEPLGPSDDLADSAALDLAIGIKLLGAYKGTTRMISDGTVTNGARVCASKANPRPDHRTRWRCRHLLGGWQSHCAHRCQHRRRRPGGSDSLPAGAGCLLIDPNHQPQHE